MGRQLPKDSAFGLQRMWVIFTRREGAVWHKCIVMRPIDIGNKTAIGYFVKKAFGFLVVLQIDNQVGKW